jgi:phage terminase large subunit
MTEGWQRAWMHSKDRPLLFVTDVLGASPEPWQAEALEAVGQHDRVSIRSGHGVGKTTLEAWLILWFLLTRKNCKVPVAANSQDQLRDTIWPEIGKWHRKLPEALKAMIDVQAERVVVVQDPEGAFAVRRTASKENPEALQGFHAEHLLFLIDEASGIFDIVFEVGMGALSTPGAKVVMAGNPTRTSGFFYDTHHSLRDRWQTMHVSCLDVPRAQGHIEDIKAKYGDNSNAWRVRVLGEFPTADDETVIPLELATSAVNRDVASLDYYPVWGVDVARFGDDRTALAKRQANRLLEPVMHWSRIDLMATAGKIKAEYETTHYDMRPTEIRIDAIGLGAGVYDRCKEQGLPVRAINVGEAAASRENCMRLRDELWFQGREWFQDRLCSLPQDDALIAELTSPTYSFTSTGKMVVESKADMKKRGMRSPDLADAFLLTFACRERRKVERHHRPKPRPHSAWAV